MVTEKTQSPQKPTKPLHKIIFLTDTHVPEHDPHCWDITLQLIQEEKPNELIIMGDFMEELAMSRHGNTSMLDFQEELKAGRAALLELRKTAGEDCKITYLCGNHETRLERWLEAYAPQLLNVMQLPNLLGLQSLGIQWIPEGKQPIQRGNLLIIHGHQLSAGGGYGLPKYHAGKLVERYGKAGHIVMMGHAHRAMTVTAPAYHDNRSLGYATGVALGCGRTLDPSWQKGSYPGWALQIALAYIRPDNIADLYPLTISNKQLAWGGKVYTAKPKRKR